MGKMINAPWLDYLGMCNGKPLTIIWIFLIGKKYIHSRVIGSVRLEKRLNIFKWYIIPIGANIEGEDKR